MIRDFEFFFGRSREVSTIFNRVSASTPQSIAVVGLRRIGKSSLLYYCTQNEVINKHLDKPDNYLFTFLDLQSIRGADTSLFFNQLAKLAKEKRPELSASSVDDFATFLNFVKTIQAKNIRWIILLDEFETLTRNHNFNPEFYSFLRSLANNYNVAYITATGVHLEKLCHTRKIVDSPFFNIFMNIQLGPFSEKTCREMISILSLRGGISIESHADTIIKSAGRLPMFLQIGCANVFDYLCSNRHDVTVKWSEIHDLFMDQARSHFNYLWRNFGHNELRILGLLSQGKKIRDKSLSHSLRDLVKNGLVDKIKKKHTISSKWFKEFIQEIIEHEPPPAPKKQAFFAPLLRIFRTESEVKIDRNENGESARDNDKNLLEFALNQYRHSAEVLLDYPEVSITIMFADIIREIEGSNAYERPRNLQLIQWYNEILFPVIEENHGKIIKSFGNTIIASFNKSIQGLAAAMEMQNTLVDDESFLDPNKRYHIRIVVNTGKGILKKGEVLGKLVEMTTKLKTHATPRQIVISEPFYKDIDIPAKERCRFIEKVESNDIHGQLAIYEVLWLKK